MSCTELQFLSILQSELWRSCSWVLRQRLVCRVEQLAQYVPSLLVVLCDMEQLVQYVPSLLVVRCNMEQLAQNVPFLYVLHGTVGTKCSFLMCVTWNGWHKMSLSMCATWNSWHQMFPVYLCNMEQLAQNVPFLCV